MATTSLVYPPIPLTANTTTISGQSYGNGIYTASSSSYYAPDNFLPYKAFTFSTHACTPGDWCVWGTSINVGYDHTSGLYTGTKVSTIVNGVPVYGEWLDISLPNQIMLGSYLLRSRNDAWFNQIPNTWIIAGSNDGGNTWSQVDSQSNITFTQGQSQTFIINNNNTLYNKYRIIIKAVQKGVGDGDAAIYQWSLYDISSNNTIAIASASYNYNQQQVANAIAAASASFNFNQIQLLNATNAAIASGSFNFNQQQMTNAAANAATNAAINAAASASYNFNQLQLANVNPPVIASSSPVITVATAASPSPVITVAAASPAPVVATSPNNLNTNFTPIVVPTSITSTFVPASLLNNVAIYQTLSGYLLLIAIMTTYISSVGSSGSGVSTMNYYVCDGSNFINIDINNIILDTPTLVNCDTFSNYIIQLINNPSISTAPVSYGLASSSLPIISGNSSFMPPTCSILCPNGKTSCVIGGICTCCDVARDKNYLGGLSSTETTQLSGISSRDTIGNLNEIQSRESNDVNMLNKFTATGDYKVSPTIVTIPPNKSLLPRKVSKTCFPNITTSNITTFKVKPIKGDELTSEFTSDNAIDVNYDIDLVQNEIQKPTYLFIIIGVAITLFFLILLLIYYFNIDE